MRLRHFLTAMSGASALEFASVSPILIFTALGMIDGWSLYSQSLGMHAAVQAGAKYFIQGGTAEASGQAVVNGAWANPPQNHTVTVTKACTCSGLAFDCNLACAITLKPTVVTYTIAASGQWSAPFNVNFLSLNKNLSETEVVRVR